MDEAEAKRVADAIAGTAARLRITKVVATRTVKGSRGETFAGFSGAMESIEDPSGMLLDDAEHPLVVGGGLTLNDAKLAHLILSMTADTQALDAAWAAGNITSDYRRDQVEATRKRYALLLRNLVLGPEDSNNG